MTHSNSGMRLLTLYVPVPWIEMLDNLVKAQRYSSRSDAMRTAIRDLLKGENAWSPR